VLIFNLLISTVCLAKEPRVFCRYNHQGISKVYNPAYENSDGNIVYAKTIEEYAKSVRTYLVWCIIGCDNSTMVNSIGLYFDITKIQKKKKKLKENTKRNSNNKPINSDKKNVKKEKRIHKQLTILFKR